MTIVNTPIISVVMPLFNKGPSVERAVMSVLAQTILDFELIVIDDGSTDNGAHIVSNIQDHRVRIISQENTGVSAARNRGIEEAQTELIAFLDADDEWRPDFLATICRLRANFPACDVYATAYYYATPKGRMRPIFFRGMPSGPWEGVANFRFSFDFDPPFNLSSMAVTKKAITSVGGFPAGITFGEDILTRVRLRLKYDVAYSTNPCSIYWAPTSFRPGRKPRYPDFVGQELERLMQMAPSSKAEEFRDLAANWHRRRGIMNIFWGEKVLALTEIQKAKDVLQSNRDLTLLEVIARMPKIFSIISMNILKRAKAIKRGLMSIST